MNLDHRESLEYFGRRIQWTKLCFHLCSESTRNLLILYYYSIFTVGPLHKTGDNHSFGRVAITQSGDFPL